jgi:superfamily II DNA helicase RecQ
LFWGLCFGGGVVLTIVPLLALSADQRKKIEIIGSIVDCIEVYNLDTMKNRDAKQGLVRELLEMDVESGLTVYLFASPQTITGGDKTWARMTARLIEKQKLKLVAIDECHLFANFGMEFRNEFVKLQEELFSLLAATEESIPVLFMTATATRRMVDDLETLTHLSFDTENDILWSSDPVAFSRPEIDITLNFNRSPLQKLKQCVRLLDENNNKERSILYSNSRKRCISLLAKV